MLARIFRRPPLFALLVAVAVTTVPFLTSRRRRRATLAMDFQPVAVGENGGVAIDWPLPRRERS